METTYWCVQHPQLPTFYLNADVQGILNADHAARVARDITALDITPDMCRKVES